MTRQRIKVTAIVILLVSLGWSARADDLATPSPTPIYLHHLAPPGTLRRMEQLDRQRTLQVEAQSRTQAREQAKANRQQTAAANAQARAVARDKERAQREVDAEARREAAKATPKATSELMKQMGFSEEEIAAQKAREASAKSGAKDSTQTPSQAKPASANSTTGDKATTASPAPESK